MVSVSRETHGENEYYRFNFSNSKFSADKIIVKVSQLDFFMFCLEKCRDFTDGGKLIEFHKEQSYITMIIHIPNRDAISYRLYDSEKRDLENLIREKHL